MAHGRQQVRAAAVTALSGLTTTGANVFVHRPYAQAEDRLPSLHIRTGSETVDEDDCITRTVELEVEGRAQATANLANTLDGIAVEVEDAIGADTTLGGVALHIVPPETEIEEEDGADKPTGLIRMTFRVMYRVEMADTETLIN